MQQISQVVYSKTEYNQSIKLIEKAIYFTVNGRAQYASTLFASDQLATVPKRVNIDRNFERFNTVQVGQDLFGLELENTERQTFVKWSNLDEPS